MTGQFVLVTGANGFVGSALCGHLVQRGYRVRGAVRVDHRNVPGDVEIAKIGEIGKDTDWSDALAGADLVVHAAARVHVMREAMADPIAGFRQVNVAGSARLARQAAEAGVERFVYLSSIHAEIAAKALSSGDPAEPYQVSKYEAEGALTKIAGETGLDLVIVRPPLVYGPGAKGNIPRLLRVIDRGLPLPLASIDNRRSLIGLTNLCDLLCRCLARAEAAGRTIAAADETVSTPGLVRRLAKALGRPARLWPCPTAVLRLAGILTGQTAAIERLTESLEIDTGEVRRLLDWSPKTSMDDELALTAANWRDEGH